MSHGITSNLSTQRDGNLSTKVLIRPTSHRFGDRRLPRGNAEGDTVGAICRPMSGPLSILLIAVDTAYQGFEVAASRPMQVRQSSPRLKTH
jgi:hypothetical protein